VRHTLDYAEITKAVAEFAEEKQYKSVEGLAEGIAQVRPALCLTASTVQGGSPHGSPCPGRGAGRL